MLYATTRSDHDTFTAQRALKEPCAPDGGLYVPLRLKTLSSQELETILNQSMPGILAAILNYFFSSKLTAKDVEFAFGKHFVKLEQMNYRIIVAECWRNPDGDFARIERLLAKLVAVDKRETPVGEWLRVVSRVGMLFCICSDLYKNNRLQFGEPIDTVVLTGDFSAPMAAWVARKMGLPIGNIVCCCNENGAVWDLFRHGEMRTDASVIETETPKCDVACPAGIERLIRMRLGLEESRKFAFSCDCGEDYIAGREFRDPFPGMFASVINSRRISGIISNVYATNGYMLCPYSAMLYAGLMDYRANTASNSYALMICESSPIHCEDVMARALGITVEQLRQRLKL